MLSSRCPYCGEELSNAQNILSRILTKFSFTCPHCKQKYRLHYPKVLLLSIPFGIYALLRYNTNVLQNTFINIGILVVTIILVCVMTLFIPLQKYKFGDINTSYEAECVALCSVEWNRNYNILRYILVYSGCILPICFVNKNNVPMSHMWCAVFKKVRHYGKKSTCKMEFVLDKAPRDLLQVDNRFYIFYNNKAIGTGMIKKVD